MPCYYTGSREGDLELSEREARATVTYLARLLCEAAKSLKAAHIPLGTELARWYRGHLELDDEREKRARGGRDAQEARARGLLKLSKAERVALGLD